MTSRERVLAAVNHTAHDRIPVDFGGTFATSFTAPAYERLRAELGIGGAPGRIVNHEMMLVEMEPRLRAALGIDTVGVFIDGGAVRGWRPWTMPGGTPVELPANLDLRSLADGGWELFIAGRRRAVMPPGGYYFDAVEFPKWRDYDPASLTDAVLEDVRTQTRFWHENSDLAVILNVPYTIFNGTSPDFLCALLIEQDEVHERLELWTEHVLACLRLLIDAVGDSVSIMAFSGDAGMQRGPLISEELYREMILPHFRRIPEYLHTHSAMRFFYHTCGSVFRLIPAFIDLGVDILNPLQVSAAEMEAARLVAAFGGKLAFWGGGIDAQHTLVEGTEEDVRAKVREQLAAYASLPGYVFALDHNVQPDVPPANFLAMLDEVRKTAPGLRSA